MSAFAIVNPYALNQYGFPANQVAVAVGDRVGALLMDYKNGNLGRIADLILGAMIGGLMTFGFMSIMFEGRLSSIEATVKYQQSQLDRLLNGRQDHNP